MRVLGINAIFHDSSAALVVDGITVAAAEEERFTRRKHAKQAVPFSAWELPEHAISWCLAEAGLTGADLDAVAYSYDPDLVDHSSGGLDPAYEAQRTDYARRAPSFLQTLLPDYDPAVFRFVRHHVAHAASAGLAFGSPVGDCAVLAIDGRGEATSMLAGEYRDGKLDILADQPLPHSLGLLYEDLTMHLGFVRSSDEYKVMAMASYGEPRHRDHLRQLVHTTPGGGFVTEPVDWEALAPRRAGTRGLRRTPRRSRRQRSARAGGRPARAGVRPAPPQRPDPAGLRRRGRAQLCGQHEAAGRGPVRGALGAAGRR